MSKLHIFIDTNVWLSFYAFTSDDLEQLKKLVALVKNKKIILYMNDQIVDEFYRNRERKLNESLKDFEKVSFSKSLPRYIQDFPESKDYIVKLTEAQKARDVLVKKAKEGARERSLAADTIFSEIVLVSPPAPISPNEINSALQRRLRGNPPGKPNSLGDQIHWENLLTVVPPQTDLHILSKDGDFESALDKGSIDQFLFEEWKKKKDSELTLHIELRPFLVAHFPEIKFATDIEKNEAVDRLINSGSFTTTHNAVSDLSPLKDTLTWEDADRLFNAAAVNSQISWIGSDSDVSSFFCHLLTQFGSKLDSTRKNLIQKMYLPGVIETDPLDEDVPF